MRKIEQHERRVANIHRDAFEPFMSKGEPCDGQSLLQLENNAPHGTGFHIYRMDPGTTTTPHEHSCNEQFLILAGDLTDNDGYEYHPGDLVLLTKGTQHSSTTKNGCTLAVYIETMELDVDSKG